MNPWASKEIYPSSVKTEVELGCQNTQGIEVGGTDVKIEVSLSPVEPPQFSPPQEYFKHFLSSSDAPAESIWPPTQEGDYVPLPSSSRAPETNWSPRDRSRSPIRRDNVSESGDIVIGVIGKDGTQVNAVVGEQHMTTDSHELFSENNIGAKTGRGSGRGRGRGSRRGRGAVRSRGRSARGRRGAIRWAMEKPLEFIYTKDEDIPPAHIAMVKVVMRKREERMQIKQNKIRRSETDGMNEDDDHESHADDEFQEASEGSSRLLEGELARFEWYPMDTFRGEEEVFQPERTGSVRCFESGYETFRSYWDYDILQHIVNETNEYAKTISSTSFKSEWYPTNAHEILCLFAFWVMLGIIRMPTIKSCFSVDPILKTDVFRRIFTLKRHTNLTRAFRFVFADPDQSSINESDPLFCLKPIIDHLNFKFKENYILAKDICIDENLILWKGKFKGKNIRTQANKFGIRTFELCESASGYLWAFLVYTGKQCNLDALNPMLLKSTSVILKLVNPLLNKGHRLFMDNMYNSPLLARFLKLNKTDCVGTLCPSRRDVPVLITETPLKEGQYMARHSGDVCVLAWQDKKRITMLSTCHGSATALPKVLSKPQIRAQQFRPQMVLDFNRSMGGVDMKDQLLEPYLIDGKRCPKSSLKLFKRLLNCSILNARTLLQSSTESPRDHLQFKLNLVDVILTKHLPLCPLTHRNSGMNRSVHSIPGHIVLHPHWPVHMEQSAHDAEKNRQNRKRCVVCVREGRKNQKTPFMCESCEVPLCVLNCFKTYHSA